MCILPRRLMMCDFYKPRRRILTAFIHNTINKFLIIFGNPRYSSTYTRNIATAVHSIFLVNIWNNWTIVPSFNIFKKAECVTRNQKLCLNKIQNLL